MTQEQIAARNRANAKKSTGPKTEHGKAMVAGNARRHSATSRPDPALVTVWLEIILDAPEDLMPFDGRGFLALALAEAEARLFAAERALIDFERAADAPDPVAEELSQIWEEVLGHLRYRRLSPRKARRLFSVIAEARRNDARERQRGGERHRLLKRYLAEARSRRRSAFSAWIAAIRDGGTIRAAA